MKRLHLTLPLLVIFFLAAVARAADDTPTVATAQGTLDKVAKDSLTIRPRGPDGKFEKAIVLKLTGTTKITTLTMQTRGGKKVPVQKDTDAKDLAAKQSLAIIYTGGDTPTLLAAVVLPSADK